MALCLEDSQFVFPFTKHDESCEGLEPERKKETERERRALYDLMTQREKQRLACCVKDHAVLMLQLHCCHGNQNLHIHIKYLVILQYPQSKSEVFVKVIFLFLCDFWKNGADSCLRHCHIQLCICML